jgi:hypothetical protein
MPDPRYLTVGSGTFALVLKPSGLQHSGVPPLGIPVLSVINLETYRNTLNRYRKDKNMASLPYSLYTGGHPHDKIISKIITISKIELDGVNQSLY